MFHYNDEQKKWFSTKLHLRVHCFTRVFKKYEIFSQRESALKLLHSNLITLFECFSFYTLMGWGHAQYCSVECEWTKREQRKTDVRDSVKTLQTIAPKYSLHLKCFKINVLWSIVCCYELCVSVCLCVCVSVVAAPRILSTCLYRLSLQS